MCSDDFYCVLGVRSFTFPVTANNFHEEAPNLETEIGNNFHKEMETGSNWYEEAPTYKTETSETALKEDFYRYQADLLSYINWIQPFNGE